MDNKVTLSEKTEKNSSKLENYKELVHKFSRENVNYMFFNKDIDHAVIVSSEILRRSNIIVRIMAGRLCDTVGTYTEYLDALRSFLDKPVSNLKILLNDFDESVAKDAVLYQLLNQPQYKDKVTIKTTNENLKLLWNQNTLVHVTIGDKSAIRIETATERRSAMCNMNHKDLSELYISEFDKLFNSPNSETINISQLVPESVNDHVLA